MKPKVFELKVIQTIKELRILKNEKQICFAKVLSMSESNYWKIEAGQRALSIDQLIILTEYIGISYLQVLIWAENLELDS